MIGETVLDPSSVLESTTEACRIEERNCIGIRDSGTLLAR